MTGEPRHRLGVVLLAETAGHDDRSEGDDGDARSAEVDVLRVCRAACAAHAGRVVGRPGGAVLAAFDTVDSAVRGGLDLLDAFMGSEAPASRRASIRAAIHVGGVEESSEGSLTGDAVEAAQRLARLAESGSLVLSDVAQQLLRDRSGVRVEDLGELDLGGDLGGVAGPVRLYAISRRPRPVRVDVRQLLGQELAPLQLLGRIREGSRGDLYLVRDPRLRRTLAVKVVRSSVLARGTARSRFLSEARIIASLSHPNVIGVHSVGELPDGTIYFLMDHVEGRSLAERLSTEVSVSQREARRLLGDLAAGLEAAHVRGLVHGDLRPDCVLLESESRRALITGWGLPIAGASARTDPGSKSVKPGAATSPRYMSPEQLAGDPPGAPSDVYVAGLLAFEALAGRSPFDGETPHELLLARLRDEPPRLGRLVPDADPELEEAIDACLSRSPTDRPSAGALARRFAVGVGSILEWPTPGMEGSMGRAWRPVADGFAGMHAWLLALLIWIVWGDEAAAVDVWVSGAVACMVALLIAFILLFRAGAGLLRLAAQARTASRLGYDAVTILDVLADTDGTSGMLMAGTHRFARRSSERRRLLIHLRRSALLAAAASTVVTAVVGLALAQGWIGAVAASAWWLGAPIILLLLRERPWESLLAGGRPRAASDAHDRAVVEGWYHTLTLLGGRSAAASQARAGRVAIGWASAALSVAAAMTVLVATIGVRVVSGSYDHLGAAIDDLRAAVLAPTDGGG